MKMKSKFQERLEYHIAARKENLEPIPFVGHVKIDADTCEKCGKTLEIDQVHKCPHEKSLAELANEFEDRYNAKMGRSGVRWAGD
jgi:C4-type Zn-finger protein